MDNRIPDNHRNTKDRPVTAEQAERLIAVLGRIEKMLDEFAGALLNAKFPYGRATDRWRRSA